MWSLFLASALAAPTCIPSRFIRSDGVLQAIMVTVDLDGASTDEVLWAQLDTGIGPALRLAGRALPGRIHPRYDGTTKGPNRTNLIMGARLGEHAFPPQPIWIATNEGHPTGRVGSVGLAAFYGHLLTIDFKAETVCVGELPPRPRCWTPLVLNESGSAWIRIEGLGPVVVDTGSAPQGIWTNEVDFVALTGKALNDPAVTKTSGTAFGHPITIHSARATTDWKSGELSFISPLVTHVPGRSEAKNGEFGVLGMVPFLGGTLTFDLQRGRLGVTNATTDSAFAVQGRSIAKSQAEGVSCISGRSDIQ